MDDEIRFYVMRIGYIESDLAWIVANSRPATINDRNRPAKWIQQPVLTFLVQHSYGTLLYDTGCSKDAMDVWPDSMKKLFPYYIPEEERLEDRLRSLGVSITDVDTVVLSHLHADHAGNIKLFRHAKILVHRNDFAHALVETHANPNYTWPYIKRDFDIDGFHYDLIEEDFEIWPGIGIITLEGHTAGLLGLVVNLKNSGTIICTSDAIYHHLNYGPPIKPCGALYDSLGFMRTVKKVRALERRHEALVIFGHDKDQYEQKLKKIPEFYT